MVVADRDAFPDLDIFVTSVQGELRALASPTSAEPVRRRASPKVRLTRPGSDLRWRRVLRSLRPRIAIVETASAPSTHSLGFAAAVFLYAEIGITSKWTAIVPVLGSRLNTTVKWPSPNSERSIRNT